jgi:hypothetical protein
MTGATHNIRLQPSRKRTDLGSPRVRAERLGLGTCATINVPCFVSPSQMRRRDLKMYRLICKNRMHRLSWV